MDKKIVRVLVGGPKAGDTDSEAYDDRLSMFMHLGNLQVLSHFGVHEYCGMTYDFPDDTEYQFSTHTVGDVFPAYAREQMGIIAADNGFDYLFQIDDDMITPPNLFELLVRWDVDIVAPLAFTRFAPHKPVIYNVEEGYDPVSRQYYYTNYTVERYPKNQLVRCDAVGFGAALIKVDVLRRMKKPWFMTTSGAGEDIHFCHMAGKHGFKVFMDTSTKLVHLGSRKKISEATYEGESKVLEERIEKGDIEKYTGQFGRIVMREPVAEEVK